MLINEKKIKKVIKFLIKNSKKRVGVHFYDALFLVFSYFCVCITYKTAYIFLLKHYRKIFPNMIYEKLEVIEKLAAQLQQVIADLRHENSVLKEINQQLRSKNLNQAIEISSLEEQLMALQAIGKSNIYSLTTIKQQGTEGVAQAQPSTTDPQRKLRNKAIEAEKPQKAVRKPRKTSSIDLLEPEETNSAAVYAIEEMA